MPISTQGFTISSVESDHTNPGSPNSLTDCMSSENCSLVVSPRNNRAELFDRPRCGFSINQLPVLALAISSSSAEKTQIVALRRTPPLITASAPNITMSYASMGLIFFCPFLIALSSVFLILVRAFLSGSGPGALPPLDFRYAPAGRIPE